MLELGEKNKRKEHIRVIKNHLKTPQKKKKKNNQTPASKCRFSMLTDHALNTLL